MLRAQNSTEPSIRSSVKLDAFWSSMKWDLCVLNTPDLNDCYFCSCIISVYHDVYAPFGVLANNKYIALHVSYLCTLWLSPIICASKLDFATVFFVEKYTGKLSECLISSAREFQVLQSLIIFNWELHCTWLALSNSIFSELVRDEFSFHDFANNNEMKWNERETKKNQRE